MGISPTKDQKLSFSEKTTLRILDKMNLGYLEVTLSSGSKVSYGDINSNIRADIKINNSDFFKKVMLYGDIGFGEAYVDGDFETSNITELISWVILNIENTPLMSGSKTKAIGLNLLKVLNRFSHMGNSNTKSGSAKNIAFHYDLSNDFYSLWLDKSMTYSSALFTNDKYSLYEAQQAKYESLCKSLNLQPGDEVLEIGSGWGGMAIYMAKNYNVKVTGVTISKEQYNYSVKRINKEGLEDKIEILLQDYRNISGKYDKIVSIEMIEAVGDNFLITYFSKINEVLKRDGLLALQAIISPDSRYHQIKKDVDWIQKHIFPGGLIPSVGIINKSINKSSDLTLVGLKQMGFDYAKTLNAWRVSFNNKANELGKLGFDDIFMRKWNYYLSYCEAAFKMRNINVVQMLYTRPNNVNS